MHGTSQNECRLEEKGIRIRWLEICSESDHERFVQDRKKLLKMKIDPLNWALKKKQL